MHYGDAEEAFIAATVANHLDLVVEPFGPAFSCVAMSIRQKPL